jgi:hypothetical protein
MVPFQFHVFMFLLLCLSLLRMMRVAHAAQDGIHTSPEFSGCAPAAA